MAAKKDKEVKYVPELEIISGAGNQCVKTFDVAWHTLLVLSAAGMFVEGRPGVYAYSVFKGMVRAD